MEKWLKKKIKKLYRALAVKKKELKKLKNYLNNNIENIILFINKLHFLNIFFSTLFFLSGFILLYFYTNYYDGILFLFITNFLIYILILRLLKLGLFKDRNTKQNKFFYNNISIYILNITIFFSLVIYIITKNEKIESKILNYLLENKIGDINYFIFIILLLILLNFILIIKTLNLKDKIPLNEEEQKQIKIFQEKINKSINNNLLIKFFGGIIKKFVAFFKKIQFIFIILYILSFYINYEEYFIINILYEIFINIYLLLLLPIFIIYLNIIFLYLINIPKCISYSIEHKNNIRYNGWPFDNINPNKLIQSAKHVDKSIKRIHSLSIWSLFGTIGAGFFAYNTWHHYSYPTLETPAHKINEAYIKPGMKKYFNIPSDVDLEKLNEIQEIKEKKD